MRDALAERLLAEVMKWSPEDDARERPDLQALASYRYDGYRQFFPGMKFIESLEGWLAQFDAIEERIVAYNFVKKRLVFVSDEEMNHLVSMAYPDVIRDFLVRQVSKRSNIPEWHTARILSSQDFKISLRQSLFLGMSDGAHSDVFRRSNPEISNEQVRQTHEISKERARDMRSKLTEDLTELLGEPPSESDVRFRSIFLLDDFSASGLSYIRKLDGDLGFTGKVFKLYQSIFSEDGELKELVDKKDLTISLVLYIATERAIGHLKSTGRELFKDTPFAVLTVHPLQDSLKIDRETDREFYKLVEKYYDKSIETKHYLKGRRSRPFLGFDECALPIVLSHNTPNNSVPILWFPERSGVVGLFPRVSRF